jgi:hypothetical protein
MSGYVVPELLRGCRFIPRYANSRAYLSTPDGSAYKVGKAQGWWPWSAEVDEWVAASGAEMTSIGDDRWLCVDCDTTLIPGGVVGLHGFKRLLDFATQAGEVISPLSDWLAVATPGHAGGRNPKGPGWHFWFPWPEGGVKLGALARCPNIEIKAFCTAPGSPGYEVRNVPPGRPRFPAWLLELAGRPDGKAPRAGASGGSDKVPDWEKQERENITALRRKRADRLAARTLDDEEYLAARGERVRRTAAQFAALPAPVPIIAGVLGVGRNLLGGPSEAGKSLLARDWLIHVAAGEPWRGNAVPERRTVLLAASEGLHDFADRWETHPHWAAAQERILIDDTTVNLTSPDDVGRFLKFYDADRPGLVCFDLVYDMGMADDTGTKDVGPVLAGMSRIAEAWECATLAVGHPGHNGERRFRGSSGWRQRCLTEWHLADGIFTSEKNKLARKSLFTAGYEIEYPALRWLAPGELAGKLARDLERSVIIMRDIKENPADTANARAKRLAGELGVSLSWARTLIGRCQRR